MKEQLKQHLIRRIKQMKIIGRKLRIKKMPAPKSLIPLERLYFGMIRGNLDEFFELVKSELIDKIQLLKNQKEHETKIDAYGEVISSIIGNIKVGWTRIYNKNTKEKVKTIAGKVNQQNLAEQDNIIHTVLGVNPLRNETWLSNKMKSFTAANVDLIKSIPDEYLPKVERIIRNGVESGESTASMANKIYESNNVSINKAKLIARDQVSKFNASLTELRQKSIGIDKYIWRTSQDERVRGNPGGLYPDAKPSHWKLDGKTFYWDNLKTKSLDGTAEKPRGLNPGMDYNCRCVALPILDEFM